jgi:hypothetical protein
VVAADELFWGDAEVPSAVPAHFAGSAFRCCPRPTDVWGTYRYHVADFDHWNETTIVSFPDIDWSRARLSMKEQVDLRRFLRAKEHFLANRDRVFELWVTALCNVFGGIINELPSVPDDVAPILTVPVLFPQQTRFEHQWIIGGTGHGKTNALASLLLDDLQRVAEGEAASTLLAAYSRARGARR